MNILNKLLKNTNTSAENKLQERVDNVQSAFEESESEKVSYDYEISGQEDMSNIEIVPENEK